MRIAGNHRGAALLMALAAMIIVSALGVSMTTMLLCGIRLDRNSLAADEIRNAAESGIEYALWRLAGESGWRGEDEMVVPNGKCSVLVTASQEQPLMITSRAFVGERTGAVRVLVTGTSSATFRVLAWTEQP